MRWIFWKARVLHFAEDTACKEDPEYALLINWIAYFIVDIVNFLLFISLGR